MLPRTSRDAERVAQKHDFRLKRGACVDASNAVEYRHAFEVRHPSYFTGEFFELLRELDCAWVIADTAGKFPYAEDVTSGFVYVRLHGSQAIYASSYDDAELAVWAKKIRKWKKSRDVYVYFDNDIKTYAPYDAMRLMGLLQG